MTDVPTEDGWHVRRFDEMALVVNDRVDDPSKAGVDRYVGLEHLDPRTLTISRWGSPTDVEATKLRFRSGDIIFGRRRAYQRKLAVADFDGISSAHAMVLRAMPEVVLPEFLPFFMQSDLFMERAEEISVGSLSPTINWKTLAAERFRLPPRSEQQRIADILASCDSLSRALADASRRLHSVETATIDGFIAGLEAAGVRPIPLAELCSAGPDYGVNAPATAFSERLPRFIRITDIDDDGNLRSDDPVSVALSGADAPYRLRRGDLLFARTGATVGKAYLADGSEGDSVFAGYLVRFTPDAEVVEPAYLFAFTRSSYYTRWVRRKARVGAQPNINAKEYGSLPVWLAPRPSEQRAVVRLLDELRLSRSTVRQRQEEAAAIKSRLASDLLSEGG